MLELRKRRMAAAHPVLRGGFRPFFLGSAIWAVLAIALWVCVLARQIGLPTGLDNVAWHRHEMIFGFVGAAVAGFLLTAVPNWTGRLPIAGTPLLSLFGLWAGARVAVLFSLKVGLLPAAVIDVTLFVALAALAGREVLASSKNSNLPIVGIVLALGLADAADYAGTAGVIPADLGWRAAVSVLVVMISLIGGRIIPSFTRNWLMKQRPARARLPTQAQKLDGVVIASTAIALLFWLFFREEHRTGFMLILAAAAQALRLSRWVGYQTARDPLVFVLHIGYAWIPVGLLLLGLAVTGFDMPESAGVHALTAGAMSTMILAVMSRATLGHTGRDLRASPVTIGAYVLVTAGASVRVAASAGLGDYAPMLNAAGVLWAAAFALFLVHYGPILWHPRLGEP